MGHQYDTPGRLQIDFNDTAPEDYEAKERELMAAIRRQHFRRLGVMLYSAAVLGCWVFVYFSARQFLPFAVPVLIAASLIGADLISEIGNSYDKEEFLRLIQDADKFHGRG